MKFFKHRGKNQSTGMWNKSLLLFLLLFISFHIQAQHKLILYISDTTQQEISLRGGNAEVFQYLDKLTSEYRDQGFITAGIDSIIPGNDSTLAYIHKGRTWKFESAVITGKGEIQKDTSAYNSWEAVETHIDSVLKWNRNNGYPFASAISMVKDISTDNRIQLEVTIRKGRRITLDTLMTQQEDPPLSASFLYAFLDIRKGEPFSEKKISGFRNKISKLEFVEVVAGPTLLFKGDEVTIKLKLKTKAASSFDGIIGFTTGNEDKLELSGKAMIDLVNSLSNGERIHINWSAPGNKSQSLQISAAIPYLLGTPFGVSTSFNLYKQDSSYVNLDFRAGIQYRFSYNHLIEAFYHHESSNVISYSSSTANNLDYSAGSFGIGYSYTDLDALIMPRKGWKFSAEFSGGKRQIERDAAYPDEFYDTLNMKSRQARIHLLGERYFNPATRSVILIRNITNYLQVENITSNQLYRLGGINSLKGFDEDIFRASAYSLLHLEYRFLLEQRSYLAAFWNGAAMLDQDNDLNYPMGFGAGIAFQTAAGIFNLYYALGKNEGEAVLFRNSKIHFGYISRF